MQHFFSAPKAVPATHPRRRRKRLRHAPASGCRPGPRRRLPLRSRGNSSGCPGHPARLQLPRPSHSCTKEAAAWATAGSTMPGQNPRRVPDRGVQGKEAARAERRRREQSGRRAPPSRSAGFRLDSKRGKSQIADAWILRGALGFRLDSKRKDPAPLGKGAGPWFRVGTRDGAGGLLYRPRTRRASRSRCRFGSPACRRSAPTLAPRFPASSTPYTTGCLPSRRRRSSTRRRGRRD